MDRCLFYNIENMTGGTEMQKFHFYIPTEVVFGKSTELEVGNLKKKYHGTKVLIVYGGGRGSD